jgi:hypothetical protein
VLRAAARAAEDAGDFDGAMRLVRRLPDSARIRSWLGQLEEMVGLPAHAPQRALWLLHPALRWARERPAGEVLERYAHLLLMTLGILGPEREQLLGLVAATDPVVLDAGLFDAGLFQRYLSESLSPALLSRLGPLGAWPAQQPSVFRLDGLRGGCVVLDDLCAEARVQSLIWPAARLTSAGTLMFGRLVPVTGAIGWAFAIAPLRVDQRCAVRLQRARQRGEGPEERLRAIARFRRREQQGSAAA